MATSKLQALWNHPAGPKTSQFNSFFYLFSYITIPSTLILYSFSIIVYMYSYLQRASLYACDFNAFMEVDAEKDYKFWNYFYWALLEIRFLQFLR